MKHPIWIINSTLLVLILCAILFVLFFRVSIPEREEIEPIAAPTMKKDKKLQINLAQIYQADLFGTYQTTAAKLEQQQEDETLPAPPEAQVAEIPELPQPQFLDPLDITLRGIFVVSTDSTKNRTIITDNKTKKEASYKIGDTIGDAQLIRIFGNKIILLRSNGQQEVLYVREQDAKMDAGDTINSEWNMVVQALSGSSFLVDPRAFVQRVPDLSDLIERLHLITAYRQGQSIGCRIGSLDENSLGTALGLQAGDIITSIDMIPATNMDKRLQIYESILSKGPNDTVTVQLMRNKQDLKLKYTLKELFPATAQKETPQNLEHVKQIEQEEKKKILHEKYEFAPTFEEIKRHERQMMLEKGQAPQS
jgi:type II secretory pathway component PulC